MRTGIYTTFQVARMIGVYPTTVAQWIDEGKLEGYSTPGGHRRVYMKDLIAFMKKHDMPIPASFEGEGRIKVLIVDDDEQIRSFLTRSLAAHSFLVHTAEDGFTAGQKVSLLRPDLIILDLMLPGIDGFKVCRMVKDVSSVIKIIAITGYPEQNSKNRILEAGADAFLAKPFAIEDLLVLIERLTDMEIIQPEPS